MKNFEYVVSGLGYTKIPTKYFENEICVKYAQELFSLSQSFGNNHNLSLLYNAYVEKNFKKSLVPYKSFVKDIYTDSGGLQIAQKNMQLTTPVETKIYNNQLELSTIAMSFDDIPISIVGAGDPRTNMNIKKFVVEDVEKAGYNSGQNLLRQLEHFSNNNNEHNTKPLIIIQGNSLEDFKIYFNKIIGQIPENLQKNIAGYAIAGSSIGIGMLEAFDSIYSFLSLDLPNCIPKHIHFLGYGAINRMLPIVIAYNSGLLKDWRISYDSTTHTSNTQRGEIITPTNKKIYLGNIPYNPVAVEWYGKVYDEFENEIVSNLQVSRKNWIEYTCADLQGSVRYQQNSIKSLCSILSVLSLTIYSIKNFIQQLELLTYDFNKTTKQLFKHNAKLYQNLLECNSANMWFDKYRPLYSQYIGSERIERIQSLQHVNNLDGIF